MRGRSFFQLPEGKRPSPTWWAASIALHGALVVALVAAYRGYVLGGTASPVAPVTLIAPAPAARHAAPPPPAGRTLVIPRMSAPIGPVVTQGPVAPPIGDTAGVVGGVAGGTGIAMTPNRGDSRLWVQPMFIPEGGGRAINMDSMVRQRLAVMAVQMDSIMRNDSLSPLGNPFVTPRWTFTKNGKTYGMDAQGIHFGTFTIPTAVLAFLPFPQGNIDQARANARMMDMRADILRAASRAEAEEDFRRAVQMIRERKDRERREQRERDAQQHRDSDKPIP